MPVELKKTVAVPESVSKPVKSGPSELQQVLTAIAKDKGEKIVYRANAIPTIERLPTGLFEFDLGTGGGFPKGRVSQVYGPEASGKSNICYCAIAQAQKLPPPCNKVVLVSMEGTEDPNWMVQFGINMEELIIVRPGYGEEAVDLIVGLVQADDVALIVIDSLAMMTSSKEVEQSTEKFDVGTAPMLIKRLSNKLAIALAVEARRGHVPVVLAVNQTRFKIGVMFGDPETYPGGQAWRFLLSLNVRVYGKPKAVKEIHPDLAIFRETSAIVKKAKVPVCQSNFKYDMCVHPHEDLGVGESDSFKTVLDHLKVLGSVEPTKGGWQYAGVVYPTQAALREAYITNGELRLKMQGEVIDSVRGKSFFVEEKEPSQGEVA